MNIVGIDVGSSTTKIIFYSNNKILYKKIIRKSYVKEEFDKFLSENNINNIDKIVFTGIGADKINENEYKYKIEKVAEFEAIAKGGLYLGDKEEAIIISVGTGTAFIKASKESIKHLGGTGVGAGTLFNLCNRFLSIDTFDKIYNLSLKGNIEKIDLRIDDVTDKQIETLPKDLTLSNFGKFEKDAKKEDIVLGIINMIFETIGMMAAFVTINSGVKNVVLIGNITALPKVKEILKKIEFTHDVEFTTVDDAEYAVALGAIKSIENKI